ncbi:hypothetical protein GCM10027030_27450 [Luteococcus sediminum]
MRVRRFEEGDAAPLTDVLHEAYAELAGMGLNFTAVDQDVAMTARRAAAGTCWVAERGGQLLGTVTVSFPPYTPVLEKWPAAATPGTAWLNQLAVAPRAQGTGLAGMLFRTGVQWARDQGATLIGLDTAVPAAQLVALYRRWGFAERDTIHWDGKTYDSVVMTRPL